MVTHKDIEIIKRAAKLLNTADETLACDLAIVMEELEAEEFAALFAQAIENEL